MGMLFLTAGSLAVLAAGFVQGLAGFGFVLVVVPVLLVLLDPPDAVSLSQVMGLFVCLYVAARAWRYVKIKQMLLVIVATLPGIWFGAAILLLWPASGIKILAGLAVIASTIPMLFGFRRRFRRERSAALVAGGISGLLQGSTGLAGPPVVILLANQGWDRDAFRASVSLFLAVVTIIALIVFRLNGILQDVTFVRAAMLFPALLLGVSAGVWLAPRIDAQRFQRVVTILILCTGTITLITGATAHFGVTQ